MASNESSFEPSPALLQDPAHSISFRIDADNGDVYLECASRLALQEFARSLLAEAEAGSGWAEFSPLECNGTWLVVNGARLKDGSSRLFVSYPEAGHVA